MGAFKLDSDVFSHIKQDIIKVGNKLEFKAINGDMIDFHIDDVRAKYKVISSIPSIDTSVCYTETVFNFVDNHWWNKKIINMIIWKIILCKIIILL